MKDIHEIEHKVLKYAFSCFQTPIGSSKGATPTQLLWHFMKDPSLSTSDVRGLVNKCRNELKDRSIPILCEAYDGQWLRLCTFDESGISINSFAIATFVLV